MKEIKTDKYLKLAGYNERKKRDGTGPFKDSNIRKRQNEESKNEVKGRKRQKGEQCPFKENKKKTKKAFNVDSKKELAYELLQWHGGQTSPLYSVGSSWAAGKYVPTNIIEEAIAELEDLAQAKVNYPSAMTSKDIKEVRSLQGRLKHELEQQKAKEEDENRAAEGDWEAERANERYFENRGPEPIQGIDY